LSASRIGRMNLYLAIRWGNADSPDGPDGDDTIALVRASSVDRAAEIADHVFSNLPTTSPLSKRSVQPFCHRLIEIGEDGGAQRPDVVLGPFVAGPAQWGQGTINRRSWKREGKSDNWQEVLDGYSA
jgi:hypothetical protein